MRTKLGRYKINGKKVVTLYCEPEFIHHYFYYYRGKRVYLNEDDGIEKA